MLAGARSETGCKAGLTAESLVCKACAVSFENCCMRSYAGGRTSHEVPGSMITPCFCPFLASLLAVHFNAHTSPTDSILPWLPLHRCPISRKQHPGTSFEETPLFTLSDQQLEQVGVRHGGGARMGSQTPKLVAPIFMCIAGRAYIHIHTSTCICAYFQVFADVVRYYDDDMSGDLDVDELARLLSASGLALAKREEEGGVKATRGCVKGQLDNSACCQYIAPVPLFGPAGRCDDCFRDQFPDLESRRGNRVWLCAVEKPLGWLILCASPRASGGLKANAFVRCKSS
eukprot:scaffold192513_cov16-Tisochrysis_lutea.AAC.1